MKRLIIAALISLPTFGCINLAGAANVKNMLCDETLCLDIASRKEVMLHTSYAPINNPVTLIDTYTPSGKFGETLEVDCGSVQVTGSEGGGFDSIVNIRPHDGSEARWRGVINGVIQEACADQD